MFSVVDRVMDVFDGVFGFSFFLERTVEPGPLPITETLRVVVVCLDKFSVGR
jgi:hypothetical protein